MTVSHKRRKFLDRKKDTSHRGTPREDEGQRWSDASRSWLLPVNHQRFTAEAQNKFFPSLAFRRSQPCGQFDLGLLAQNCETINFCYFKLYPVWCFVMPALANEEYSPQL